MSQQVAAPAPLTANMNASTPDELIAGFPHSTVPENPGATPVHPENVTSARMDTHIPHLPQFR
jgi:hypothetical protein